MSKVTIGRTAALAIALAGLHLVLALVYSAETPYRAGGILRNYGRSPAPDIGAPDERQHANYVQTLLNGEGFPVFKPERPDAGERIEDHQPPLYYVMAAGWGKITGVSNVDAPEGVRLRWLNSLIGAGTVLGIFYLGLWSTGRPGVGLGAAGIAAVIPMHTALSGAVSNDPLLFCLCTWTLAVCARGIREGWNLKLAIAAGVLTGLGIITKTTSVSLLPILLLAVLLPQVRRPSWAQLAVAAVAIGVIAGPWLARNQTLYGDPLARKIFATAFTNTAQKEGILQVIQAENPDGANLEMIYWRDWVGWWGARSFFGAFGYMDIWLNGKGSPYGGDPNALYRILLVLSLAAFAGWLAVFGKGWREIRSAQILNGAFIALTLILFAVFNAQYFQGQGRYLYPAIGPIAVAIAFGCLVLLKDRAKFGVGFLFALLLAVNVYALSRLPDEFERRKVTTSLLQYVIPPASAQA